MTDEHGNDADYRLGRAAVPRRYELKFVPNLERASFSGRASIELQLKGVAVEVECHAAELEISDATIRPGRLPSGGNVDSAQEAPQVAGQEGEIRLDVSFRPEAERVVFSTPARTELPAGDYVLSCSFAAPLNDKLRGFYRSRFEDPDGNERVMAVTHFESHDARRAFPCFDEPDRKAVFSISLEIAEDLVAVSNAPVVSTTHLDNGRKLIAFGDSPVMSTYLVCFVVGPLESSGDVRSAGVPVGVLTPVGKSHLTGYALETAAHALSWFAEYFALPYPGDKLDLVDVPDFAMGAMENLGCVTFRETDLLCDPDRSSIPELARIAEVIEHELAHMWFGDLVTMKWWDDIWLNEAFATFMSLCCLEDFRPQWHGWVTFGRDKDHALGIDALHTTRAIEYPVRRPDEAEAMFDALTYLKGGNVLRMLEQFVGPEAFRDGVRHYLKTYQFSNTEAADLWDALEASCGGAPVRDLMHSWISQGGFPLVSARREGDEIELYAKPFSYLSAAEWKQESDGRPSAIGRDWFVPVLVSNRPPAGGAEEGLETVLLGPAPTLSSSARLPAGEGLTVVNAGGSGTYRVRYEGAMFDELATNLQVLRPLERFNLVSDSWAIVLARLGRLEKFLSLVGQLGGETDPNIWAIVSGAFAMLDLAVSDDDRPALAEHLRKVMRPELERVCFDAGGGEVPEIPRSRAIFITALGTVGADESVRGRCGEHFAEASAERRPLPAGTAEAILRVVGWSAERAAIDAMWERVRRPLDPLDGERHLFALVGLRVPALVSELQELCRSEVRSQDAPYVLRGLLANRVAGPSTWRFISAHWDELRDRFASGALPEMISGLSRLADVDATGDAVMAAEIRTDLARRDLGGHRRRVDQHLERLAVNVAFVREHRPGLGRLLADL